MFLGKKLYYVYIIQGYDSEKPELGRIENVVTFEIIANTYEEAVKKCQKICPKPHYRLTSVINKYEC